MLEVNDLACERGERRLFSGLTFAAAEGTLLRVAGANGSGKTSLLRIVCALMLPAHGEVLWKGSNIRSLRENYWQELAYVGHLNAVKDDLTSLENLTIGAALAARPVERDAALAALELFGIAHCAPLPARVLSQGQRRRVALARLALGSGCPLWVLDEPFTALDASAVTLLQSLISQHLDRGGIVVLTTHQEVSIAAVREQRVELGS